jgi:hypothetical protein
MQRVFCLLQKRKLGPGSYDIKDFLEASEEKPRSTRGIIQTKEPRFQDKFIVRIPHFDCICYFFYIYVHDTKI